MEEGFAPMAQEAVKAMAAGGAVLLDVRRDDEWAAGHAKGAVHWELARLQNGEWPDVAKDAKVFVYCAAGGRAGQARELLMNQGWTDVTNIGGLKDWQAAGGEVEQ